MMSVDVIMNSKIYIVGGDYVPASMSKAVFATHLYFLAYFLLLFLPPSDDLLLIQYFVNLLLIVTVSVLLVMHNNVVTQKVHYIPLIVFIAGCAPVGLVGYVDLSINLLLLNLKVFLIAYLFLIYRVNFPSVLKVINLYYFLYVLFSLAFWLDFLPFYKLPDIKNDLLVDFVFFKYYVLFGFEGSPTLIGAYSFFVALINLLYSNNKKIVVLALLCGILSFRLTALISFVIAFGSYFMFRSKNGVVAIIVLAMLSFIAICFYASMGPYRGEGLDALLYKMTHARSMLWGQFINVLSDNYGIMNYVFGGYEAELFLVPAYQENGDFSGRYIANPHSDILFLFLKWPLAALLYFLLFFYMLFKSASKKYAVVVLYILLVSVMNSDIISLRNPVYLIVFTSLFVAYGERFIIGNKRAIQSPVRY